jgi:hypothetical protein
MTQQINGLLVQKQERPPPEVGEIRFFSYEERQSAKGNVYVKIFNQSSDEYGEAYRILKVHKTDHTDKFGNVSYSINIEPVNSQAEQTASGGSGKLGWCCQDEQGGDATVKRQRLIPQGNAAQTVQPASAAQPSRTSDEGVIEAKRHIMKSVNLYNLCVEAVDKSIKPNINGMTAELYQAAIASIWIEASSRRSDDGVHWWSWIDRMPEKPI